MTDEMFPPCYHDNRLRQLAAWMNHPTSLDKRPEPKECLAWLISQPSDSQFRAVMFKAANLPVYEKEQWFLLGWRERTPCYPKIIELLPFGVEDETAAHLKAGNILRLETKWLDGLWDVAVKDGWEFGNG